MFNIWSAWSDRHIYSSCMQSSIMLFEKRKSEFMFMMWSCLLLFPRQPNLTLHSDRPDLPECFQLSVLPWAPCIYLWAVSPLYILYLKRNSRGYIMMSILNRIKTVRECLFRTLAKFLRMFPVMCLWWFIIFLCAGSWLDIVDSMLDRSVFFISWDEPGST